jgi:hypothetical protein
VVSDKEKTQEEDGWERGFTVEEHRVAEYVELYESIGYEVRIDPATPDNEEECQECLKADFDKLRTIFINRKVNEMNFEE